MFNKTDCEAPTLTNSIPNKEVLKHNETVTYVCDDGYVPDDTLTFACSDGTIETGNAECKSLSYYIIH